MLATLNDKVACALRKELRRPRPGLVSRLGAVL